MPFAPSSSVVMICFWSDEENALQLACFCISVIIYLVISDRLFVACIRMLDLLMKRFFISTSGLLDINILTGFVDVEIMLSKIMTNSWRSNSSHSSRASSIIVVLGYDAIYSLSISSHSFIVGTRDDR